MSNRGVIDMDKKYKTSAVIVCILLAPLAISAMFITSIVTILWLFCYGSFYHTRDWFMSGMGFETQEQIMDRIITEKIAKGRLDDQ